MSFRNCLGPKDCSICTRECDYRDGRWRCFLVHVFTAVFTAQSLVTNTTSFELRTTKTSQADLKSAVLTSKSTSSDEAYVSYDSKPLSQGPGLALLYLSGAAPGCIPECIWPSLIIMRQLRGIEPTSLDEIEERENPFQKLPSGMCECNDLYVKLSSQS